MVFSSIIFIFFFFPVFLLTYYAVPKAIKNYVLLAFSIFFYAWGAPWFVIFLIPSTITNFYLVKYMHKARQVKVRRLLLSLSIAVNLGLLLYFKYANFFMENVNYIRGWVGMIPLEWQYILLPIGISFFTFQSITYTMDVYRKVHAPLENPFNYMLYIMMFPQMIAGPIVRYQQIADQLTDRQEKWEEVLYGFYRFAIGLAKKVLIADVLGANVDEILDGDYAAMDSTMAWIGIVGYTFQLYFDFAGYSDMAIGIGRMIGFRFPENFDNPYVARSVSEFWRRWHQTFSIFMRNYLYYPLGGSRVKTKRRLYFNLWFVFLISGLWHGASWNFVIYGAFHGIFLVLDRLFLANLLNRIGKVPSILFTFLVIVMARVFFRIEEFDQAIAFLKILYAFDFSPITFAGYYQFYSIMGLAIFFSFITIFKFGLRWQEFVYFSKLNTTRHILFWICSMLLLLLSVASLTGTGFSPFIYFRF
jgi:alginate O-acetyltransferase complex protein AlgI